MKDNSKINGLKWFGFIIVAAAIAGWCMNVYSIFMHSPAIAEWAGMEVVRVIGVFVFPIGCVLGYF